MNRATAIVFVALALLASATADKATPIEVQDEVALFEHDIGSGTLSTASRELLQDYDYSDKDKDSCAKWTYTTTRNKR